MLMFVLPLFRVIVEPLSMAATLIWLIGVSFVELKFLPTLPPLVPASYEVPPHQRAGSILEPSPWLEIWSQRVVNS